MASLTLTKVHDVRRDPQSGARRLMGENHYISFRAGDGPTVFVQNGRAFSEGGPEMPTEEIPAWFVDQAKRVSASKAEKVGLDRLLSRLEDKPAESGGEADAAQVDESPDPPSEDPETDDKGMFTDAEGNRRYWCSTCRESMEPRKKGGHMMSVHGAGKR